MILNEVNSSNPSQLRCFIEVAGQRAGTIIAKPAGIQVDGACIINASRATLTTGAPVMNGGSLEGDRVQRGVISINGAGLDATLTDHTGSQAWSRCVGTEVAGNSGRCVGTHASGLLQEHDHPCQSPGGQYVYRPSTPVGDSYPKLTVIGKVLIVPFKDL